MELGILAVTAAVVGGGVVGAVVRSWSILTRLYSLEDRANILEGTLTREVKTRAAGVRWSKRDAEEAILQAALDKPAPVQPSLPWWVTAKQSLPRSVTQK